jgi:Lipocalin-like domain
MTKKLFLVVAVLAVINGMVLGQTKPSKPSIQGVWRAVEITVTNPNPPPNTFSKGTHTNVQPELLIFTAKHYSLTADTAAEPRPTTPVTEQGKPTVEELQSRWGPFAANAGTYEISGDTLTRHVVVAKNPAFQGKNVTRATIKLDGNNLWVTQVESARGKVENPTTVKYVRVE